MIFDPILLGISSGCIGIVVSDMYTSSVTHSAEQFYSRYMYVIKVYNISTVSVSKFIY